ncbi:MAG TPA: hypothetical protein ENJ66_02490 [Calditrichae bacterium]|nr:hypothetical protein [Calditrichia bacterium]
MMYRFVKLFLMGALLLGMLACEERTGPFPPPFEVEIYRAPDQLNLIGSQTYRFEARVSHPAGLTAIKTVTLEFFLPGEETPVRAFTMVDDGGVKDPDAGDVVANDGIFTRVLNPRTTDLTFLSENVALFRMVATDDRDNAQESRMDTVAIIRSTPPKLLQVTAPDTLQSGVARFAFVATVSDSDGFEDILFVLVEGWRDNQRFFTDTLATADPAQETFTLTGDSTFAAEKQGLYQLRFAARDRSGNWSNTLERNIFIENTPPVVAQTVMPDTVQLPPPGQQYLIRILARVWDAQGLGDVRTVSFTVQPVDGDPGDPIEMFDNGNTQDNGDDVAGDGIFSRIITLNSNNTAATYLFTFTAEDRVGQVSVAVVDTMVIIQ